MVSLHPIRWPRSPPDTVYVTVVASGIGAPSRVQNHVSPFGAAGSTGTHVRTLPLNGSPSTDGGVRLPPDNLAAAAVVQTPAERATTTAPATTARVSTCRLAPLPD